MIKKIMKLSIVFLIYLISLCLWILFVPSFKLLNFAAGKLGLIPVTNWSWLGVFVETER